MLLDLKTEEKILTTDLYRFFAQGGTYVWREDVAQFIADELTKEPRKREGHYSASSLGRCAREQGFRLLGAPEKRAPDSELNAIFEDGKWRHLKWQAVMLQTGLMDRGEVPVYHAGLNLKGTLDGVGSSGEFGKYGIEIKGANSRSFDIILRKNAPMESHILQVHAYMLMSGIDLFSVIYEDKNTSEWKEFVIRRDEDTTQRVVSHIKKLDHLQSTKILPAILSKCEKRQGRQYETCPFKSICLETGDTYEAAPGTGEAPSGPAT